MRNERTASTTEELAQILINGSEWIQSIRFTLESHTRQEYDDPEAGKLYDQGFEDAIADAIGKHLNTWEVRSEYLEKNPAPSTHPVTHWYLLNSRDLRIQLSSDLGEALDRVWTKSPRWRGEEPTVNLVALSLKGMLERLGVMGLPERIKAAQKERWIINQQAQRPDRLKRINQHLLDVVEILSWLDEADFINSGMTVVQLLEKTAQH